MGADNRSGGPDVRWANLWREEGPAEILADMPRSPTDRLVALEREKGTRLSRDELEDYLYDEMERLDRNCSYTPAWCADLMRYLFENYPEYGMQLVQQVKEVDDEISPISQMALIFYQNIGILDKARHAQVCTAEIIRYATQKTGILTFCIGTQNPIELKISGPLDAKSRQGINYLFGIACAGRSIVFFRYDAPCPGRYIISGFQCEHGTIMKIPAKILQKHISDPSAICETAPVIFPDISLYQKGVTDAETDHTM